MEPSFENHGPVWLWLWYRNAPAHRPGGPWWGKEFETWGSAEEALDVFRPLLYRYAFSTVEPTYSPRYGIVYNGEHSFNVGTQDEAEERQTYMRKKMRRAIRENRISTESRFSSCFMSGDADVDLQKCIENGHLVGIVDEECGGIIAYALGESNTSRTVACLNACARVKNPEAVRGLITACTRMIVGMTGKSTDNCEYYDGIAGDGLEEAIVALEQV